MMILPLTVRAEKVEYPVVTPGRTFRFPRDHGAHPEHRVEWWYVTGWLGERVGFQVTFFRARPEEQSDNPSSFNPRQVLFAHAAVSEAARGRLFLALDGTGFKARVGGSTVLAVHGNEVDPWNVVEHERLRQIARDRNQGRPVDEWTPNAGTKLVIDVMNDVKRKMPLVDLLKPEDRAVVPVILALDRTQAAKLTRIAPVLLKLVGSRAMMAGGFLSGGPGEPGADVPAPEDPALAMDLLLGDGGRRLDPANDLDQVLAELDRRLDEDPVFAATGTTDPQMLGRWGLAWDVFRNRDPEANLREALQDWLAGDRTFDHDQEDETFRQMDRKVGSGIDFLLTGHTHLERALQRRTGGVYFNSGTWIRLIRLRQDLLAHAETFTRVFQAFRAGTNENAVELKARRVADRFELGCCYFVFHRNNMDYPSRPVKVF